MPQVDEGLLKKIVNAIREETDPEQIVLFGSYARGDAGPRSDLDLLIVERNPFTQDHTKLQESARLYKKLAPFHVPKDILIYSRDQVEEWRGSLNHVIGRAMREGKVLYERR